MAQRQLSLADKRIVVRWEFDELCVGERGGSTLCFRLLGCYPQGFGWAARFASDRRFVFRAVVPVHNDETAPWRERLVCLLDKGGWFLDTVEGICDENNSNRLGKERFELAGVAFDALDIRELCFFGGLSERCKQVGVNIDSIGGGGSDKFSGWQREVPVSSANIRKRLVCVKPECVEDLLRVGPQFAPPLPIRLAGVLESIYRGK